VRRRSGVTIVSFALSATLLVACGGDDDGSGAPAQDPNALEDASWVLTEMADAAGDVQAVDVEVTASFDGSTISGTSGCNQYNASYQATGNEISFGPIAGTQMACPGDEMAIEARYVQLLREVATFQVDGGSLSMDDGEGTQVLLFGDG
jgi:heat shock protein HslJ